MLCIVAIFYIAALHATRLAVDAVSCVPSSGICFLTELDLERERIPLVKSDSKAISMALQNVNDQLEERVETSDFDKNIKAIKSMLKRETRVKHMKLYFCNKNLDPKEAHERDILINVLLRLRDLRKVQNKSLELVCSDEMTEILQEVDELAHKPVTRLHNFRRNKAHGYVLLSRLDYFIVEAVRRRARKCDPEFDSKHLAGAEELGLVVEHYNGSLERLKMSRQ